MFKSTTNKEENSTRDLIRSVWFEGMKIGEENKERALILSMKDAGITDEKIKKITESSKQYLVTKTEMEAGMKVEMNRNRRK